MVNFENQRKDMVSHLIDNRPTWHRPMVFRLVVSLDTQQGSTLSSQGDVFNPFGGQQQSVIVTTTSDFATG